MSDSSNASGDFERAEKSEGDEPSQQKHHDAETEEDTASGGAPRPRD